MTPAPNTIAQAPASKSEVIAMIAHLSGVMDELLAVIEQETALVRAGKLAEAAQLSQRKTDLARVLYVRRHAPEGESGHGRASRAPTRSTTCASGTTCSMPSCRST